MKLLTDTQRQQLLANGRKCNRNHVPVVRFFNPYGLGTWLFSESEVIDLIHQMPQTSGAVQHARPQLPP